MKRNRLTVQLQMNKKLQKNFKTHQSGQGSSVSKCFWRHLMHLYLITIANCLPFQRKQWATFNLSQITKPTSGSTPSDPATVLFIETPRDVKPKLCCLLNGSQAKRFRNPNTGENPATKILRSGKGEILKLRLGWMGNLHLIKNNSKWNLYVLSACSVSKSCCLLDFLPRW